MRGLVFVLTVWAWLLLAVFLLSLVAGVVAGLVGR